MSSFTTALREAFLGAEGQQQGVIAYDVWAETTQGKRIRIPAGSYVHFCNDAPIMSSKKEKRSWNFADIFVGVKIDTYVECTGFTVRVRPNGKSDCVVSMGTSPGGQKVQSHYDSARSMQTIRASLVIR